MSDLELRVSLTALDNATAPMRNAAKASQGMAAALREASKEMKALKAHQRDIGALRQHTEAQRRAKAEWQSATEKVRALSAEHAKAGAVTKAMARDMAQAQATAGRLKQEFFSQGAAAQTMRDRLAKAGIATSELASHEKRLRAEIERTSTSMAAQGERMRKLEGQKKAGMAMGAKGAAVGVAGMGMAHAGKSVAGGVLGNVSEYKAHEDAMLGIARQVPGARNEAGKLTDVYRRMEAEVRSLSEEIPQTTVEIASMFTAAARMDVPVDRLREFTKLASDMGTAFDSPADEMAESMGKVANNLKIPITEIRAMADAINYLDDNAISKGKDIVGFMNRVGGISGSVGITGANMAALGSTLLTSGETEETAGTSVKAIMNDFAAATRGAKKFKGAVKDIGMTPEQLQAGMAEDAVKTLLQVTEAVKNLPKKEQFGVMSDLVGKEHVGRLAKLVNNTEEFRRQLDLANSAEAKGSMGREADARNDTFSAKQKMLENRMFNLKAAAGETLVPALTDLMKAVGPLISKTSAWVKANPELTGTLMKVGLGIGVVATALGTIATMAGGAMIAMGAIKVGMAAMALAGGVAIAPMLMAGAAIAGVITAGVLLYRNWDAIKGHAALLWQDIKLKFSEGLTWLGMVPAKMAQMGGDMMRGLVNGIKSGLASVGEAISGVADSTVGWFKSKLGINSPSRVFTQLGGWVSEGAAIGITEGAPMVSRAAAAMAALPGLVAAPAMAAMTGIAAPAMAATLAMAPMQPAPIEALAPSAGAVSTASNSYAITINAAPGQDPQAIARAVSAELDRRERSQQSRGLSGLRDR